MPSEDELKTAFIDLANAVRGLQKIPIERFAGRLYNKARYNPVNQSIFGFFGSAPDYNPLNEEDSFSQNLDGRDATHLLCRLGIASVGQGTIQVSPDKDYRGYKRDVKANNAEDRFGEIITILMTFCLAEHIDAELMRLGQPSIKDLSQMPGFADYAIKTMSTERWINQEISIDLWRGDHLFTISMLLLADFLKTDPGDIPAYDDRIENRPSYQVLQTWSYAIWGDEAKGDESARSHEAEWTTSIVLKLVLTPKVVRVRVSACW